MNKTSWIFIACTIIICAAIGVLFIRPIASSSWKIYNETKDAKNKLAELSERKQILTDLSKNNQLANLYNIASKYIPEEANSGALVIELTAIAGQANLKVEQVSLESDKNKSSASTDSEAASDKKTETKASAPAAQAASGIQEVDFSMRISGNFSDYLNFLKNLETSSRLISLNAMNLSQKEGFSAEIKGKTYWKKSSATEAKMAQIKLTKETIAKFQNLKTYGTPIDLPSESGFGRSNPFESL